MESCYQRQKTYKKKKIRKRKMPEISYVAETFKNSTILMSLVKKVLETRIRWTCELQHESLVKQG